MVLMYQISTCDDLNQCQRIWEAFHPQSGLFDQWAVRAAFHRAFDRPPCFIVASDAYGQPQGMLAMSWIEELGMFGAFPGETWNGKTWIEQNRFVVRDEMMLEMMLEHLTAPFQLRYCVGDPLRQMGLETPVDEIGYLFHPGQYQYEFSNYMQSFSGKSRKALGREIEQFNAQGVSYRFDCLEDVERLFQMNCEAFGEASYFYDTRFLAAFENLINWTRQQNLLRVTTILIGGAIAAIDLGMRWRDTYTLIAGATNPAFPGIAKMINFHHLEWACRNGLREVDFLCGNFGWKERFHLTQRPLYEVNSLTLAAQARHLEMVG